MKQFTHFYCLLFVCCTSTSLASDGAGIDLNGSGVERGSSSAHKALSINNYKGKRDIHRQRKDPLVIIPGYSREAQKLREGKEIHLKIEERTFEGIEPHHFNELDFTLFRHNPVSDK